MVQFGSGASLKVVSGGGGELVVSSIIPYSVVVGSKVVSSIISYSVLVGSKVVASVVSYGVTVVGRERFSNQGRRAVRGEEYNKLYFIVTSEVSYKIADV